MTFLCRISQRDIIYTNLIVFDNTFVTVLYSITGDILASLSFHMYFDSSLLFLYLRFLKFLMWLPKRYLKSFCNSKVKLFSPLVGFLVRCLVHYFWGQIHILLQLYFFLSAVTTICCIWNCIQNTLFAWRNDVEMMPLHL